VDADELEHSLAGLRGGHQRLLRTIESLSDEQAGQPSKLPDWTVGHVLTHLARNADGLRNVIEGASAGEVREQYPGGVVTRQAGIAAGAGRPARELVDDVRDSVRALEASFASATPATWAGHGVMTTGDLPVAEIPWRRWREVEVHHVDLGLTYTLADWPSDWVRSELARLTTVWASRQPMGMTTLPAPVLAATPNERVAWFFGRLEIDGVGPAGVYG